MRITAVELRRYSFPLEPPFRAAWDPVPRDRLDTTLVFVTTDEGLTGVGSGDTMDGFERFEPLFVGHDPLDLERHVRVLEAIAFHAGRPWPLEAALWDLAGKAERKPVAELLGGAPRRLPAYASSGEAKGPDERAEAALARREEGFRALKLRIDAARVEEGLAAVRATREALDGSLELMVDLNQGWRMPWDTSDPLPRETVRRVAGELADLGVLWLEEPLPAHDVDGLRELRRVGAPRIAGGEMVRSVHELLACVEARTLDVVQPDAILAVGMARACEVARRAQAAGLWFTPHTWTNGLGLAANLHVASAVDAGPYLEFPYDPPGWTPERRDPMLAQPLWTDADGYVACPTGPGLGVDVDEERLAAHRVG